MPLSPHIARVPPGVTLFFITFNNMQEYFISYRKDKVYRYRFVA